MNRIFPVSLLALSLVLFSCDTTETVPHAAFEWTFDSAHADVAQYVDPMIGTGGHGHTFPGACAPFGMVQLSPDTRVDGSWDGCSGYHHDDDTIYGFSHTHLSGTGCSDYGDIMLMPGIAEPVYTNGFNNTAEGYGQAFRHEDENAEAGYYSVKLNNGIQCELTASPRVGVHRYNFYEYDTPWIILDMTHRDEVLECELEIVDDHTIRGKRFSKAWATNQQLWFYAEFSEPFTHTLWSDGKTFNGDSSSAKDLKAVFSFNASSVEVKVALSPVSCDNAKLNLQVETAGMDFDAVRAKTVQHWNSELSRIEIETDSVRKKTIFYTALYHCFIAPNVYCDVNGEYQGMDHKVYRDTVHQRYTVFSLWDTYRALHPLFTIVQQKRTNDFINTFLQQYKESGRLPVWELSSNETDCMIGYHSVSVITDAWIKGITGFDTALAYEAMKASAMEDRFGLEDYRRYGFIPAENEGESVSRTLEYAYDDWCIAQCARTLQDSIGEDLFKRRSKNWKNVYNPETGFMQARLNNSFLQPFNPFEVNFHYTEANAWQYSLTVQHDPLGLIGVHTAQGLNDHLDSLFNVTSKTSGREQADITGLIGQYAHGNEPSHHMTYLYAALHEDYKTQQLVHSICNTLYTDQPDGLCGNEDCGQMSAWYVLSASGFYPVTPGSPSYTIGSPQFASVKFHLENGKTFTLNTSGVSADAPYVWYNASPQINGQPASNTLTHAQIMKGSTLELVKSKERESVINNSLFLSLPYDQPVTPWITGVSSRTFTDRISIGMSTGSTRDEIFYSINGESFKKYSGPVTINTNSAVEMYAVCIDPLLKDTMRSDTGYAQFFKAPAWKSIAIRYAYAPQYAAGGDRALIDGLKGTEDFRTGLWQGYEGVDLDITIDLGTIREVNAVNVNFLHDQKSWIFLPEQVQVWIMETPDDTARGAVWTRNHYTPGTGDPFVQACEVKAEGKGRYIRVVGTNRRTCPQGHPGAGKPAWLFCDEISIITK